MASMFVEDPSSTLGDFLSTFRGKLMEGRYWTVFYDPRLPFVLKLSKRPRSRKSMGRRATKDFTLISRYLSNHVPWQCVFEADLSKTEKAYLLVQDLIVQEYSLGAIGTPALHCSNPMIDRILSSARLKENVLDFIDCVVRMNREVLAVPDLWGATNLIIHRSSITLVDTSVLYSPAEDASEGREGYFMICRFINELLWLLGQPECIAFSKAPRNIFSLEY